MHAAYVLRHERWPRCWLVPNDNGHIHKSRDCTSCHPTTQWKWLPELSGLSEPELVAEYGALMCSVCYPSAPV